MMQNKDFAVFIITHGRPDNVVTLKTLKKCNYTGRIYFIVDNEDKTVDKYFENFGKDKVVVFDKKAIADKVDEGNNFDDRKTTTHARNACFEIAKDLNITNFLVLDDDYTDFLYRFEDKHKVTPYIKNIDKIFSLLVEYSNLSQITSLAFAQGGDFIGGVFNGKEYYRFNKRKCMNSFFCSTNRQFNFIGQLNEDVNTYITLGNRGMLFLTIAPLQVNQKQTQAQTGGMSDAYMSYGTYCKSFTTVMMHPSGVKVSMMNSNNPRLHHSISWKNTTPMIISQIYKKY